MEVKRPVVDQERVRTTLWLQIMAAASLAHLQQDLGEGTPFPVRLGRYRILKEKNGLRIENINSPNYVENQVKRLLSRVAKQNAHA